MRQIPSDSQARPNGRRSDNAGGGAAGATFRGVDAFASRVADKIGLSFPASRRQAVAGAIRRVMARRHIDDARLLLDQIGARQDLTDELVDEVTVGETCFFRGPAQFRLVRHTILPELRRRQAEGVDIRIWSAGCATGEEPYSLAILCEEDGLSGEVRIAASDISRKALADAMEADYGEWSLRNTGGYLKDRYFRRHGTRFRLRRELAERVRFTSVCLGTDTLPAPEKGLADFDLILCRNVLVYLDAAAVRRIARQLFDCLAAGGWLTTAPADPPLWKLAPFETLTTAAGVVYRRPLNGQDNRNSVAAHGGS
ncbi:protein-glutamate O-methyltransferase CheR [Sinorhizobium saheli]|uniref:CheR-type methyltransferase domain-containing protein n=1 Tax=Sinorhizobium saheli TaxID=36856 RepID=A0A178Y8V0_SINSA|nr:protein-glutamate O-methyltransferase CheR [Sinorhizobium saheli]OAP43929.1 hypothetical protein ATB98_08605 [Sinorhizobium saheli]